jgi:hypothetical protein
MATDAANPTILMIVPPLVVVVYAGKPWRTRALFTIPPRVRQSSLGKLIRTGCDQAADIFR